MFLEKEIKKFLKLGKTGVNGNIRETTSLNSLKRLLIEAKVLVDRWDLVTTHFIFNSDKIDYINKSLDIKLDIKIEHYSIDENNKRIWGTRIITSDYCPSHLGIAFADHYNKSSNKDRCVSIFPTEGFGSYIKEYGEKKALYMFRKNAYIDNIIENDYKHLVSALEKIRLLE